MEKGNKNERLRRKERERKKFAVQNPCPS